MILHLMVSQAAVMVPKWAVLAPEGVELKNSAEQNWGSWSRQVFVPYDSDIDGTLLS